MGNCHTVGPNEALVVSGTEGTEGLRGDIEGTLRELGVLAVRGLSGVWWFLSWEDPEGLGSL